VSRKPLSGVDTARVLWRRFEIERERQLSGLTRGLSRDEVEAAAMAEAQNSEPAKTAQAEPATLPQGEAAAVPKEGQEKPEPKPQKRSYTQARAAELADVLNAIEARARECGVPLVRSQWPGTKAEFRDFLKWHAPGLSYSLPTDNDNLTDELRPHGVAFGKPGRARDKGKKIYQALFPDYPA